MSKRIPVSYSDPEKQIIYPPSSSIPSSRIPSPDSIVSSRSSSPAQSHAWNPALFVSRSKEQQPRPNIIYWRAKRRTVIGIIILVVVAVAGIVAGITAGILGRRPAIRASPSLVSASPPLENTSPPQMTSLAPPPNSSRVPTPTGSLPAPAIPSPDYIVIPSALTQAFNNTSWIWDGKADSVPAGDWAFRMEFSVKAENSSEAVVLFAADNNAEFYSNGKLVANDTGTWMNLNVVHVPLEPGSNVFALRVTNQVGKDGKNTPAGLLLSAQILYADGTTEVVSTDATWRTTQPVPQGFEDPDFKDTSWKNAVVVGNGSSAWKGFEVPDVDASG